jgi:hypothetical protein
MAKTSMEGQGPPWAVESVIIIIIVIIITIIIVVIVITALQSFVGPWPLFHFLDPIYNR